MRVLVTGGGGMLGSAVARALVPGRSDVTMIAPDRRELDLSDFVATKKYIRDVQPNVIVHCAARVGGIAANIADPTGFLLDNLVIDTSIISAALGERVPGLVYIGSATVYPGDYRQPLLEGDLLAGQFEAANEGYGLAKVAGAKLCEYASKQYGLAYRALIPSNLYGPHAEFAAGRSHLIAAALVKSHEAKVRADPAVLVWGDGTARREFTHVDDIARWVASSLDALDLWPPLVNVGCGKDHSIREYYELAREIVGFSGALVFDETKPSGQRQRLLDSSIARGLGWEPRITLHEGVAGVYSHYLSTIGA